MANTDKVPEFVICLSNCNTEPLIMYGIPQLNMDFEIMSTNTHRQYNDHIAPQTTFSKIMEMETKHDLYPQSIFIETEEDGDGFCAFSEKYHRFLGYGKTKEEAIKFFIELFKDKKHGEQLSNYYFYYDE